MLRRDLLPWTTQKVEPAPVQKVHGGAHADDDAGARRPVAVPTSKEKVAKKMKVPVAQVVEVKKGGRPPKGEVAMTKTERQRAWRARVRARSS